MNIRQVAISLNMSEQAVRRAIRLEHLKATLIKNGDLNQERYEITEQDVKAWRANGNTHTQRADNRRKLTMYASPAELAKLKAMLEKSDLKDLVALINYANPGKAQANK